MKILAVDDDPLTLELLSAAVAAVGFTDVVLAASAEEARDHLAVAETPFGCFLVDIQMPGTDGIEFCAWLRKQPVYRSAPVIMVTAMSAKPFLDRAFAAGASDYVTKPFDLMELGARVRVAERQVIADQRAQRNAEVMRALRAELEEERRVALTEPVTLKEVEGAIDYLALENYLLRVGRGDLVATSIVTFQVRGIERLHQQCSPTLFQDLLADGADAVLGALTGTQALLAYAGSGTFAAVVSGGFALDVEEVEAQANQAVADLWLLDDAGERLTVELSAGAPHHLGVMTSGRSAVAELRLAIEQVRHGMAAADMIQMPRRRFGFIGSLLRSI